MNYVSPADWSEHLIAARKALATAEAAAALHDWRTAVAGAKDATRASGALFSALLRLDHSGDNA